MNHYVYQITDIETEQYYIGVRSCEIEPYKDPYMGSGNWVRNHKITFGKWLENSGGRFVKVILGLCESRELAYELESETVSEYFHDPLCMNLCGGGRGCGVGELSSKYKKETKRFWNHNTQEDFYSTRRELIETYKIDASDVSSIFKNKLLSSKGIVLYENKDKPWGRSLKGVNSPKYNPTKYRLWDTVNKIELSLTQIEFKDQFGMRMCSLISGRCKSLFNIVLYENKDKPIGYAANSGEFNHMYKSELKRMWNHNTQEEFYATVSQLKNEYNLNHGSLLFNNKRKSVSGIVLYENKDIPLHKNAILHLDKAPESP